jgi:hypothetical protein
LIINHLYIKTPETTGKKPAKPEIKNKPYMTTAHQYINPLHVNQKNQINQWFRQTNPTGNCIQPAKPNTTDNQSLIHQNTRNNRQKTGKTRNKQ